MGEEFPQNQDPNQLPPEEQQTGQIEVSYPDGEQQGVDAATAPTEQSEAGEEPRHLKSIGHNDDGRVGESKAWDMAHAGKEERDKAAWGRDVVRVAQDVSEKAPEIAEALQKPYDEDYYPKRAALDTKLNELKPEVERLDIPRDEWTDELLDELRSKKSELKELTQERKVTDEGIRQEAYKVLGAYRPSGSRYDRYRDIHRELDDTADYMKPAYDWTDIEYRSSEERAEGLRNRLERVQAERAREAAKADRQAERLETWAGILHDNPPTEAFKQKYGGRVTTPSVLVSIEGKIDREEAFKQQYEPKFEAALETPSILISDSEAQLALRELMYDRDEGMGLDGYRRSVPFVPDEVMTEVYGKDSDELTEWHRMQSDPNTTLGQLHEKYATALREAVKPFLYESDIHKAFLDDIRSGRAAQWQ